MTTIREAIVDAIIESLELQKKNLAVDSDEWEKESEAILHKAEVAIKSGKAI